MEEDKKLERFYGTGRLEEYTNFVNEITSKDTKSHSFFKENLDIMKENGVQPSRLLCAAVGLAGEVGEFNEVIKKVLYQGKELNEDTIVHMKRELGDVMWYVAQGCMALNSSIDEIIDMNEEKLKERFPLWDTGGYDKESNENRKEGDV